MLLFCISSVSLTHSFLPFLRTGVMAEAHSFWGSFFPTDYKLFNNYNHSNAQMQALELLQGKEDHNQGHSCEFL